MQLAPISSPTAPTTIDTPVQGVGEHVATGHWTAPHGSPSYVAGWWTAGTNLAPNGGWTSRTAALEGARLLSSSSGVPIAVTPIYGSGEQPSVMYRAYRLATSEPTEGDAGWADAPTQWLTSDMLRAPQFRGFSVMSFALTGIFDHGVQLAAGTST